MTKPDWCPQRVWDEASNEALKYVEWLVPTPTDSDAEHVLTVSFARAILAAEQREREAMKADFIEWVRKWVKQRFGVWITHNTAKGAFASFIEFRNRSQDQ